MSHSTAEPSGLSTNAVGIRERAAGRRLDPARLGDSIDQLRRIARSLCRTEEEADELVQETMLQVLKRPRYIRHHNDLPYLVTVMRNAFYARKHLPTENLNLDELTWEPVDEGPADVEQAVQARLLLEEIERLPDGHRTAVLAVDVSGLSYREAANALGVPEGTIMSRLYRARRQIAERLEPASG